MDTQTMVYTPEPEIWHARDLLTPEELELNRLRAEVTTLGAVLVQTEEEACYWQRDADILRAQNLSLIERVGPLEAELRRVAAELAAVKAQQEEREADPDGLTVEERMHEEIAQDAEPINW